MPRRSWGSAYRRDRSDVVSLQVREEEEHRRRADDFEHHTSWLKQTRMIDIYNGMTTDENIGLMT